MKIQKFSTLVLNNPKLVETAFEASHLNKKKRQIVDSFFSTPPAERVATIHLLLSTLVEHLRLGPTKHIAKNIVKIGRLVETSLGKPEELPANCLTEPVVVLLQTFHQLTAAPTILKTTIDSLARYTIPLAELFSFSQEISSKRELLELMAHHLDEVEKHQAIPRVKGRIPDHLFARFVETREQNMILSNLPIHTPQIGEYFQFALTHRAKLLVSLQETSEHAIPSTHFWDSEHLSHLVLEEGWRLENQGTELVAIGAIPNRKDQRPSLKRTIIRATKEGEEPRILTHLHCDGWEDMHLFSDIPLLERLLDLIEELNPEKELPVVINCHGGVGRTGEVATSLALRKKIRQAHEQGRELACLPLNILEYILQLRNKREGHLCGKLRQLPQICELTYLFYQRLTRQVTPSG